MKLQELSFEQDLIVQIIWGEQKIEFHTQMVDKNETGIYIKPYVHSKKPLELNISPSSKVICNLFGDNLENKQRVSWRNIDLQTVTKDDEILYFVKTYSYNSLAKLDERRVHERVIIRKEGTIIDNKGNETLVRVHDVSDNGFSFYASPKFKPSSIKFSLRISDVIREESFNFIVDGRIVHTKNNTGMILYGCEAINPSKDFLLYGCLKRILERNKSGEDVNFVVSGENANIENDTDKEGNTNEAENAKEASVENGLDESNKAVADAKEAENHEIQAEE